jgi:hypothetical protein
MAQIMNLPAQYSIEDIKIEEGDHNKILVFKIRIPSATPTGVDQVIRIKELPLHHSDLCGHNVVCWGSIPVLIRSFLNGLEGEEWEEKVDDPGRNM